MKASVIFDIDGTLVDTYELDGDCYVDAICKQLGLAGIDENWEAYPDVTDSGITTNVYQKHLGRAPLKSELNILEAKFTNNLKKRVQSSGSTIRAINGAVNFVKLLMKKNVPVAVATGGWRSSASFKLEQVGLSDLIPYMATSTEAMSREEILLKAVALNKVSRERVWYFGDGLWDLACTEKLGVNFIGVGPRLKKYSLEYWISDFSDAEKVCSIIA